MQVKGVMPQESGLTRQTPTGRAVGNFVAWHNFFEILEEVMLYFLFSRIGKALKELLFMPYAKMLEGG